MRLTFEGPFAGSAEELALSAVPECHYCGRSRWSMQPMDLCEVCKRPEIPPWLASSKVSCVGMRFILRGAVVNLVGVVTGINVLKRTISAITVSKATSAARHASFTKVELNASTVQSSLQALPPESPWQVVWDAHGLCQHCDHVYHVHRVPNQPTLDDIATHLRAAQVELVQLVAMKNKRKLDGAMSREIVQHSINIKTHHEKIWQLQKQREQSQGAWCPHCGHRTILNNVNVLEDMLEQPSEFRSD
ncbi:hypothetical protein H310_12534 [Aphanomyces invadans]|uniref:Uncharacterized protein n=1 Tax=Aphanomyces invadans TaxID=157072 RepID=A0A024TH58_9STRA|nr:hypothetical protein H310_12534 [Aphanomyces invadans]ETV93490.1 hypothetical protein H310_12534 [Aphanomyces invadans]|eukprot:XP_008877832.1 hypothetical protein H310_12534 [Aphanomyces invadans]